MWIRGMCRRVVQGIVHRAAILRMWEYLQLTTGLVSVYEQSLFKEPDGLREEASSVFQSLPSCSWSACQMAVNRKDGYGVSWIFEDFSSSAFTAFDVDVLQRGESRPWDAQLSARLSVELCSPGLWHYYTTLRCTESEHFLWPLNRKFSG